MSKDMNFECSIIYNIKLHAHELGLIIKALKKMDKGPYNQVLESLYEGRAGCLQRSFKFYLESKCMVQDEEINEDLRALMDEVLNG